HHGKIRLQETSLPDFHDLILTTYATLANEWQSPNTTSLIFSHKWHRLILDEAHEIRDTTTAKSRAVCGISASCRWVVTGTPIQNRLSDLFSLFQFLDLYPYDDKRMFE
ncbi:hypothetical protein LX32DRAFT_499515, partial [Colletotrichum zoysiae]